MSEIQILLAALCAFMVICVAAFIVGALAHFNGGAMFIIGMTGGGTAWNIWRVAQAMREDEL